MQINFAVTGAIIFWQLIPIWMQNGFLLRNSPAFRQENLFNYLINISYFKKRLSRKFHEKSCVFSGARRALAVRIYTLILSKLSAGCVTWDGKAKRYFPDKLDLVGLNKPLTRKP
jgi:hypothetical protein